MIKKTMPEWGPEKLLDIAQLLGVSEEAKVGFCDVLFRTFVQTSVAFAYRANDRKQVTTGLRLMRTRGRPHVESMSGLRVLAKARREFDELKADAGINIIEYIEELRNKGLTLDPLNTFLILHLEDLPLTDAPEWCPGTEIGAFQHTRKFEKWSLCVLDKAEQILTSERDSLEPIFGQFLLATTMIAAQILPVEGLTFGPNATGGNPDNLSVYGLFLRASIRRLAMYLTDRLGDEPQLTGAARKRALNFIKTKIKWDNSPRRRGEKADLSDAQRIYKRIRAIKTSTLLEQLKKLSNEG